MRHVRQLKLYQPERASVVPHAVGIVIERGTRDLIGDRRTLLVICDLSLGRQHDKEFQQSPEGIATIILADRLARLIDAGFVEQFPSEVIPVRDAYCLTKKGESLAPPLKAIAEWGLKNLPGTAKLMKSKS